MSSPLARCVCDTCYSLCLCVCIPHAIPFVCGCRVFEDHLGWDRKVREAGLGPRDDPVHLDHLAWESLDPRARLAHLDCLASTPLQPVDLLALLVHLGHLDHLHLAWGSQLVA